MKIEELLLPSKADIHYPDRVFVRKTLTAVIVRTLMASGVYITATPQAMAEEYFNPALLNVGDNNLQLQNISDLSHFEAGGQAPGDYAVRLYVNDSFIAEKNVTFINDDNNQLIPQFTVADYRRLGLRVEAIDKLNTMTDDVTVKDIRTFVPAAQINFEFASQQLKLSFPQLLTQQRTQGDTDPSSWDQGMPAALLNYAISGNQSRDLVSNAGRSEALYANLRGGINLGAWRLRSYATYQQRSSAWQGNERRFDVISSYLQRDIHAIKGQLILGDSATPGDVFDSVQFQGGQLVSDDSMLPDSLRGFAPVIRGVSESGAEVSIRQNGNVIYQSYMPPGPFEISDLYPASLSGDLVVTIKESDGSERTFIQPYSSIAIMQREGQLKYAVTMGRLRSGEMKEGAARFVQGTLIYGLPGSKTIYGGVQLAKQYLSASAGAGVGLGQLGALSADITHSDATLPNGDKSQGQSYRLRYSRSQVETGTTVSLAAYRYSTEGYYSLQDAFTNPADGQMNSQYRPRGEFQVMLNQSLGDYGSMYLSGSQRDYWSKSGELRTWSLGYGNNLWGVTYGINFSQSQDSDSGREDRRVALTASLPLSQWFAGNGGYSRNSMQANIGINHSKGQGSRQQLGLSGNALEGNQLTYNISQSMGDENRSTSLNTAYQGSAGTISAGYNRSQSQEQLNYGLRGGIVAHPYGVTLSQELGEASALVRAPGASNIDVNNQNGLSTDWRGYAVLPYAQAYRQTEVSLNPKGLGSNVALNQTSLRVIPTRGALVLADFPTQRGHQAMLTVRQESGTLVPFGAIASLTKPDGEPNTSIVGDEGQLYMSGMPDEGMLEIQWGKGSNSQCLAPFNLLAAAGNQQDGVPLQLQLVCKNSNGA